MLKLISEFLAFLKIRNEYKLFNVHSEMEDFQRWALQREGKAFFDIILQQLNMVMKQTLTSADIKNHEDFMFQKGKIASLNYVLFRLTEIQKYEKPNQ